MLCRGKVQKDLGVGVLLKETRRNGLGNRPLEGLGDDAGFALAEGQHENPPGLEDRADAHGNGATGDVGLAEKVAGCVVAGELVQPDQTCRALEPAARLVEADVPGPAYAENLKVDPAGVGDRLLVRFAVLRHLIRFDRAIGYVDVGRVDVDMIEQVLRHEPPVALKLPWLHGIVLVEVERNHVGKAQLLLAVYTNQLGVQRHRRRTGRQAENALSTLRLASADQFGDLPGSGDAALAAGGEYAGGNLLAMGEIFILKVRHLGAPVCPMQPCAAHRPRNAPYSTTPETNFRVPGSLFRKLSLMRAAWVPARLRRKASIPTPMFFGTSGFFLDARNPGSLSRRDPFLNGLRSRSFRGIR